MGFFMCNLVETGRRLRGTYCIYRLPDHGGRSASETSVNFHRTTRRINPEGSHIPIRGREYLKSQLIFWPTTNRLRRQRVVTTFLLDVCLTLFLPAAVVAQDDVPAVFSSPFHCRFRNASRLAPQSHWTVLWGHTAVQGLVVQDIRWDFNVQVTHLEQRTSLC